MRTSRITQQNNTHVGKYSHISFPNVQEKEKLSYMNQKLMINLLIIVIIIIIFIIILVIISTINLVFKEIFVSWPFMSWKFISCNWTFIFFWYISRGSALSFLLIARCLLVRILIQRVIFSWNSKGNKLT